MSYSSIIYGNTLRAAVNAMLTICLGRCSATGEANLGYVTLIIKHAARELSIMQVSYGDIQFNAPVTKKVANLYYLVVNSYYKIALYL